MSITFTKYPSNSAVIAPLRPSLKLVSGGDLADYDLVNFSRDSKKWYWGSDGVLQEAAADKLPTSYDPDSGDKLGWLIEEERTNEILDSRDMTTGNWSGGANPVRDAVGIDGQANTATTHIDNSDTVQQLNRQSITIPDDSNTHTVYIFIKKDNDESRFPRIKVFLTGGTRVDEEEQINTKTGDSAGISSNSKVEDYRDFWRVTIPITNNTSGNTTLNLDLYPAYGDTLSGGNNATTGSAIFDQAQVELNASFPTSPIITEGSTVTRSADVANITDLSWYNQSEGTFVVEMGEINKGGSNRLLTVSDNTVNNQIFLRADGVAVLQVYDGSFQVQIGPNTLGKEDKISAGYKKDDFGVSVNGSIETDSSGNLPSGISILHIGAPFNGTVNLNGHIKSLSYYKVRLSNDKLQNMTG